MTQFRAVYPELVELTAQIISNLRNRSPVKKVVRMSQLGDFSPSFVDFDAPRKMCNKVCSADLPQQQCEEMRPRFDTKLG